eukprot:PITA_32991
MDLRKLNDTCVHDPFPTPFTDKLLDNMGGQEAYSFTNGFFGYNQIKITMEDRSKTTFVTEWGCFQYTIIPFGLKNAPAIFSCVVVAAFTDFIHKFLEGRADGRPCEDHGDTELGNIKERETVLCYFDTYGILQEVYQKLRPNYHADEETIEEGFHVLLE